MAKLKNLTNGAATFLALSLIAALPAGAAPPEGNKTDLCHYQSKDKVIDGMVVSAGWYLINISVRSVDSHTRKHNEDGTFDFEIMDGEDLTDCVDLGAIDLR